MSSLAGSNPAPSATRTPNAACITGSRVRLASSTISVLTRAPALYIVARYIE